MEEKLSQHYDRLASSREKYWDRQKYYYKLLTKQYKYFIGEGKSVLEVGCGTGSLIGALKPKKGCGFDISPKMIDIAKKKYSQYRFFVGNIDSVKCDEKFDVIILSGLIGELNDIQSFFESLKRFCHKDTRIIIEYYSSLWHLILKWGEVFHFKMPQKNQNWVTYNDISNFLKLTNFEIITSSKSTLMPINIWGISYIVNRFIAKLPIFNALTLNHFVIARPLMAQTKDYSVSILVPCRNEKGNIEQAIKRTPTFGSHQEFIFVEGGSSDGTYQEIERVKKAYPKHDIKIFQQTGKGKGDAVRLGFDQASCEVLMILDADLTVAPEDLPKFYHAIQTGKGEFINGSRLVYPMEKEAMRFLNLIANKSFGVFFSWLLGVRFKDTLCGTKVLFKTQYAQIVANRSYFGDFDPFGDFDLIFGASKLNLKIIEVPIRYRDRQYGSTQIQRFRHGLLLIHMCFFAMRKIKFI